MNHHWVSFLFLLAAMACYAAGMAGGFVALLAAGVVLELVFWFRLFSRTTASRE